MTPNFMLSHSDNFLWLVFIILNFDHRLIEINVVNQYKIFFDQEYMISYFCKIDINSIQVSREPGIYPLIYDKELHRNSEILNCISIILCKSFIM